MLLLIAGKSTYCVLVSEQIRDIPRIQMVGHLSGIHCQRYNADDLAGGEGAMDGLSAHLHPARWETPMVRAVSRGCLYKEIRTIRSVVSAARVSARA